MRRKIEALIDAYRERLKQERSPRGRHILENVITDLIYLLKSL